MIRKLGQYGFALAVLGLFAAASTASAEDAVAAGGPCCSTGCCNKGCSTGCCNKACRLIMESKKVDKREYSEGCEDFCLPRCSSCLFGCKSDCADGCGTCGECGKVRTRKYLVLKIRKEEQCVPTCIVEQRCTPVCAPATVPCTPAPGTAHAGGAPRQPERMPMPMPK
jgi:hypothetical protein